MNVRRDTMFSTWKSADLKWKLHIPWMSEGEAKAFRRFRDSGQVTSFRVLMCKGTPEDEDEVERPCTNEVPILKDDDGNQAKLFCSKSCHDSVNVPAE